MLQTNVILIYSHSLNASTLAINGAVTHTVPHFHWKTEFYVKELTIVVVMDGCQGDHMLVCGMNKLTQLKLYRNGLDKAFSIQNIWR